MINLKLNTMKNYLFLFVLSNLLFFGTAGTALFSQDNAVYIGVWRSGQGTEYLAGSSKSVRATNPGIVRRADGLLQHEVRIEGNRNIHYGLWGDGRYEEMTGNWQEVVDFNANSQSGAGRGMKFITQIEAYSDFSRRQESFNVIYTTRDKQPQIIERSSSWEKFVGKWKQRLKENMRLKRVIHYKEKGRHWFVGLYHKGTHGHYLYNFTGWNAFAKKWQELGKKNYRLVDVESYLSSTGKRHYIGIWEPGKDGYVLWNVKGFNNFMKKFKELQGKMKLVDLEVVYDKEAHLRHRID